MKYERLFYVLLLCFCAVGCSIDIDITDLTLASGTVDFSKSENFEFNANYVEVKDGEIRLKPLDLEDSGDDFSRGSHAGTSLNNERKLSMLESLAVENSDVQKILPGKANALIGYWRFDSGYDDASNIPTPTVQVGNPEILPISVLGGQSVELDGLDDYLSVTDGPKFDVQHLTTSAWIFISNHVHGGSIVNRRTIANEGGFAIEITGGNSITSYFRVGGSWHSNTSSGWIEGQWNHISVTFDGVQIKTFRNGALISTPTAVTGSLTIPTGASFEIGRNIVNSTLVEGRIDELAIWGTALQDSEIFDLYEKQRQSFTELSALWTPHWENIVGYWKMDGNWQDSSFSRVIGGVVGTPSFDSKAKVGPFSVTFNGSTDFYQVAKAKDFEQVSVAGWVWIESWTGTSAPVFFRVNGQTWYPRLRVNDDGSIRWQYRLGGGTLSADSLPDLVRLNSWNHLAATLSPSGGGKVYLNGELVAENLTPGTVISSGSKLMQIARDDDLGTFLDGSLDDLAIWDTVLTRQDVKQIYDRQKQKYAGHYNSEVIDLGSATSWWPDLSWLTSLPFGKEFVGDFDEDGNPDSESSSDYSGITGPLADGLVSNWHFEEITNGEAPGSYDYSDSSGNGHHLKVIGTVKMGVSGKLGLGAAFSTPGGRASIDYSDDFNDESMSAAVWVKASGGSGTFRQPMGHRSAIDRGDGSFDTYGFNFYANTADKWALWTGNGVNASPTWKILNGPPIELGRWYHLVMVASPSSIRFFVDGVEVGSIASPYIPNTPTLPPNLHLGHCNSSCGFGEYLRIDEAQLWSRSLGVDEVQQLYRRGANRISLQVKSCVDSSCNCKSFSSSPAGSVNDCDGDGIVNAEDSDDIHQAEFMGPGGDGTTHFSELLNRRPEDVTFDCDVNISDSNDEICVEDEVLLTGSPKPTSPLFSFDDYLGSVKPQPNRYFQYRVNMEADENTACDGEPCLPELTSVNLNPSGAPKYYGRPQTIITKKPIPYKYIKSAVVSADSCASFQVSPDGKSFYVWSSDQDQWITPVNNADGSPANVVEGHLIDFAKQLGPGSLIVKTFLSSDTASPCAIQKFQIETSEASGSD